MDIVEGIFLVINLLHLSGESMIQVLLLFNYLRLGKHCVYLPHKLLVVLFIVEFVLSKEAEFMIGLGYLPEPLLGSHREKFIHHYLTLLLLRQVHWGFLVEVHLMDIAELDQVAQEIHVFIAGTGIGLDHPVDEGVSF